MIVIPQQNTTKEKQCYAIPLRYQSLLEHGLEGCLNELGLIRGTNSSGEFIAGRVHNIRLKETTFFNGINYFLAMTGDCSSMVIMLKDAPQGSPPISERSLRLFFRWKSFLNTNELLRDLIKYKKGRNPKNHIEISISGAR